MIKDVSSGKVDRRRFLQLGALGATGAALAGCTSGAPSSAAGKAARGGRLRVAASDGSPNDTLDPLRMETAFQILVIPQMYEALVDFDDGFQPRPRLAKSFEQADGGRSWTFHLRDGVTFHDGSPLTAADVAFSITRAIDPDAGSGNSLAGQLAGILRPSGIKALDTRTVRFDLDKPYVFFPGALATRFARIYKKGTTEFSRPVGTGPFRFKSFAPGQRWQGVRNPDYWRNEVTLDEYDVTNVADESARISALIAGQLDLVFEIELAAARDVTSTPGFKLLEQRNAQWIPLGIDSKVEPFNNPDVIRAIKLAVNRQQVIDNLYGGFGTYGYDNPIPEQDPYFASLSRPAHDPGAAREALAAAGHRNGLKLPALQALSVTNVTNFAVILQKQLKEVGIDFEVRRVPVATYWDNSWLQTPFYTNQYLRRHPDEIMKLIWLSSGDWNMSKRKDPEIDAAIMEASRSIGFDAQKKYYATAQRLITARDTTVIPAHLSRLSGMTDKLKGVRTNFVTFLEVDRAAFA